MRASQLATVRDLNGLDVEVEVNRRREEETESSGFLRGASVAPGMVNRFMARYVSIRVCEYFYTTDLLHCFKC